jgi:thiol-disulfide isomerase/thioredoxin
MQPIVVKGSGFSKLEYNLTKVSMKKVVLSLLLIQIASTYLAFGQTTVIHGFMQGVGTDTVFIKREIASSKTREPDDTLVAMYGRFMYQFQCKEPILITLYPKKALSPISIVKLYNIPDSKRINLFVCPNDTIEINADLGTDFMDYSVKGSKICEDICMFHYWTKDINIKEQKAWSKFDSSWVANNDSKPDEYLKVQGLTKQEKQKLVGQYILKNPNSNLSGYFLIMSGPDIIGRYMSLISPEVRNGIFKKHLQEREIKYQDYMLSEDAKNKIIPGALAPDFTLKDINGENFTLSSVKGKYVILDFWADWCSPCIKEFPKMKEYYKKYHSKIEFISIAIKSRDKSVKEIVSKNGLEWIQLFDNDTENKKVSAIYSAQYLPTKVIIDSEGKIVAHFNIGPEDFYKKLDEIFTVIK